MLHCLHACRWPTLSIWRLSRRVFSAALDCDSSVASLVVSVVSKRLPYYWLCLVKHTILPLEAYKEVNPDNVNLTHRHYPAMNRLYALFVLFVLAWMTGALPIGKRDISLLGKCTQDCDADSELTRFVLEKKGDNNRYDAAYLIPGHGPGHRGGHHRHEE